MPLELFSPGFQEMFTIVNSLSLSKSLNIISSTNLIYISLFISLQSEVFEMSINCEEMSLYLPQTTGFQKCVLCIPHPENFKVEVKLKNKLFNTNVSLKSLTHTYNKTYYLINKTYKNMKQ